MERRSFFKTLLAGLSLPFISCARKEFNPVWDGTEIPDDVPMMQDHHKEIKWQEIGKEGEDNWCLFYEDYEQKVRAEITWVDSHDYKDGWNIRSKYVGRIKRYVWDFGDEKNYSCGTMIDISLENLKKTIENKIKNQYS